MHRSSEGYSESNTCYFVMCPATSEPDICGMAVEVQPYHHNFI